jgi:hypothetical protein
MQKNLKEKRRQKNELSDKKIVKCAIFFNY